MRSVGNTTEIDYARPGSEQAPRTRVVVERLGEGWRFIDPPIAAGPLRRPTAWRVVILGFLKASVLIVFAAVWGLRGGWLMGFGAAVTATQVLLGLRSWRRIVSSPTVIDLSSGTFALTRPSRKRVVVPLSEVTSVHASKPREWFGLRSRTSFLVICAGRRRLRSLEGRNYAEVRWLAGRIRAAAGLPLEHPSEPPARPADGEEGSGPENLPLGPLPAPPAPYMARRSQTFARKFWRAYDNMPLAAGPCLLLVVIAGLFIVYHLVDIVIICLQFGADAYFGQGLRYAPGSSVLLTNGQSIARPYRVLFFVLWFPGMLLWIAAATLITVGASATWQRFHERRRRASRRGVKSRE
jgi:hypothetical protein